MAIEKKYLYKMSRNGVELGNLPNVKSPFGYNQSLFSASAALSISVQLNVDTSHDAVEALTTEDGDPITTEAGEIITTERAPDLFGDANSAALIRNNNEIEVWQYSSHHPNGVLVFSGNISNWTVHYGGTNTVEISCLSKGTDLDNYLILGSQAADQAQLTQDNSVVVREADYGLGVGWRRYGQTLTVGDGITNISSILLKLAATSSSNPATVTVKLWNDNSEFALGTPLATVSQVISSASPADYQFTFSSAPAVVAGQQYFFSVQVADATNTAQLYYQDSDVYANGTAQYSSYDLGSGGGAWTDGIALGVPADLYFETFWTTGETNTPYTANDPTLIVEDFINSYISRGGAISYSAATMTVTGLSINYRFNVNTVLDGIKAMQNLAPSDWYWYVDPGSGLLYFKEASGTADHRFILGNHIISLDLNETVENIKNKVYYTGGDDGTGSNVYVAVEDSASIAANNGRIGLAKISDTNVHDIPTARQGANTFIDRHNSKVYQTTLVISASKYDITLIKLGHMIGFAGFNNFVDNLLLQVVSVQPGPDTITLGLGVVPPRASAMLEAQTRALATLQTVSNPSSPV